MKRLGRPQSIPEHLFVRVLRLKLAGLGYQAIANELNRLGVATSRGSVERLLKGLPPYQDAGAPPGVFQTQDSGAPSSRRRGP
jgi:hypothetical protein